MDFVEEVSIRWSVNFFKFFKYSCLFFLNIYSSILFYALFFSKCETDIVEK